MTLVGVRAIVTGGARGIGEAVARALAAEGAAVAVVDADGDGAEAVASSLTRATAHRADVRDTLGLERLAEAIGPAAVLVNAAGIQRVGRSETLDDDVWDAVVGVDLTGVFRCCRVFGRSMLDAGDGAIVNVASVSAEVGMPGRAAYCAAKAGVVGLTRALGVEWAPRGVRVNAVAPGYVRTPLVEEALAAGIISEADVVARVPAGRLADPDEIADAIVFLVSPAARYVMGQTLVVDGGYLAYGAPAPTSFVPAASLVQ